MKSQTLALLVVIVLVVIAVGAFVTYRVNPSQPYNEPSNPNTNPSSGTLCTADVQLCPDGSYVSRRPPSCAFNTCPEIPNSSSTSSTTVSTAPISQKASGLGVSIIPTSIAEDSRCPSDVTCIQAGTVRVRATVVTPASQSEQTFTLNMPLTIQGFTLKLIDVIPAEKKSTQSVLPSVYRFTFSISK